MAACRSLLAPTTAAAAGTRVRSSTTATSCHLPPQTAGNGRCHSLRIGRRDHMAMAGLVLLLPHGTGPAQAASDDEYVRETSEVIEKVRSTISMEREDPNVAAAVADLREASNSWVSKYRKEKILLARSSFRDVYSALNAVSGHYISFGPTTPIPAKRKARILEEVSTAEKALFRGR